jgi:hypothetical protein
MLIFKGHFNLFVKSGSIPRRKFARKLARLPCLPQICTLCSEKAHWESDNSFDDKFRQSRYIKVLPYIGEVYFSSNIKILVPGESLYWDKDGDLNLTNCVRNNIYDYGESVRDDGTSPSGHWVGVKAFRNMAAVISGKDYHHNDHIWEKLTFHEFFQITAGKNADDISKINEPPRPKRANKFAVANWRGIL